MTRPIRQVHRWIDIVQSVFLIAEQKIGKIIVLGLLHDWHFYDYRILRWVPLANNYLKSDFLNDAEPKARISIVNNCWRRIMNERHSSRKKKKKLISTVCSIGRLTTRQKNDVFQCRRWWRQQTSANMLLIRVLTTNSWPRSTERQRRYRMTQSSSSRTGLLLPLVSSLE